MSIDLFRLGVAVILLALMFPLVEAIDKYVSTGTSIVTFFLWLTGTLPILSSALTTKQKHRPETNKDQATTNNPDAKTQTGP